MEPENTDYTPSELDAQDNEITTISPPEKNPRRFGASSQSNFASDHFLLPPTAVEPILELPLLFHGMSVRGSDDFGPPPPPPPKKDSMREKTPPNISRWQAPQSWDIVPGSKSSPPKRGATGSSTATSSAGEDRRPSDASHFQRFVRRMEGAGPRIILERLKEEWDEPADKAMSEELQLEKHLWALTALQLRALDRFVRPSESPPAPTGALPPLSLNKRRKILELDGNLGMCILTTDFPCADSNNQVRFISYRPSILTLKLHTLPTLRQIRVAAYRCPNKPYTMHSTVQDMAHQVHSRVVLDYFPFHMPAPPCTMSGHHEWYLFSLPLNCPRYLPSVIVC